MGIVAISVIGFTGYAIIERRQLDKKIEIETSIHGVDLSVGEIPRLGIIGDSWVAGNKLDEYLETALAEKGVPMKVLSFGQPGAKSRQIYRNLFKAVSEPDSSNPILKEKDILYCIVIAGINDAVGHAGKDYYAHHVYLIARTLVEHGIVPLIIELPSYGVDDYKVRSWSFAMKRNLFRFLFDRGKRDVIGLYRTEFASLLESSDLKSRVVLVDYDRFISDYSSNTEYYANSSHLNKLGMQKFSEFLADVIFDNLVTQTDLVRQNGRLE